MNTKKKISIIIIMLMLALILGITTSNAVTNSRIEQINVTLTGTKAEVTWNKIEEADGYDVYVKLPSVGYLYAGSVYNNKVSIVGLENGETYRVKVQAYKTENNNRNYSEFSPEMEFKAGENTTINSNLGSVNNIKGISYGTTGTVEWDKAENADGYDVYANVGNSEFQNVGTVKSTKVNITGMNQNAIYSIKVQPFSEQENGTKIYGTFSKEAVLKYDVDQTDTKPDKVNNVKVDMNGADATITWDEVRDADGYEVLINVPNKGNYTYDTYSNEKTLTNFTPNVTYKVQVRAFKYVDGDRIYGTYSNTETIRYNRTIGTVQNLNVQVEGTVAYINWDKVNNVDGYEIELYIPSEGTQYLYTTKTEMELTNIDSRQGQYSVRVRACIENNGEKEYGNYSSTKYFQYEEEVKAPAKVTGLYVNIVGTRAELDWNKVNNADGYEVELYIPGEGTETFDANSNYKTIYNIDYTTREYWVRVRAYTYDGNKKIYGDYSNKEYFYYEEEIELAKVTGLYVDIVGTRAELDWNSVKNADGYEVEIYTPGEGTDSYFTTKPYDTIYNIDDADGEYWVRVRAYATINGRKEYGSYSSKEYFYYENTELDRVTGLDVDVNGHDATFSWDRVWDADGYEIELTIPGITTTTLTTTRTSQTMTGFYIDYADYAVRVRAYKKVNGKTYYGAYSSKEYFRPEETVERVTGLRVVRNGEAAIFSWNSVDGADGYEIVVNIPGIGDCYYTETTTARYMTGFTETKYKYTIKVRAFEYINGRRVYGDYSSKEEF